jgi:hypothetical protein
LRRIGFEDTARWSEEEEREGRKVGDEMIFLQMKNCVSEIGG